MELAALYRLVFIGIVSYLQVLN